MLLKMHLYFEIALAQFNIKGIYCFELFISQTQEILNFTLGLN